MDCAASAVPPLDPELVQAGDDVGQRAERRGLLQGSVRPVRVVEIFSPMPRSPVLAAAPPTVLGGASPGARTGPGAIGAPSGGRRCRGASGRSCRGDDQPHRRASRRESPSGDAIRVTTKKTSLNPISRGSSHARQAGRCRTVGKSAECPTRWQWFSAPTGRSSTVPSPRHSVPRQVSIPPTATANSVGSARPTTPATWIRFSAGAWLQDDPSCACRRRA